MAQYTVPRCQVDVREQILEIDFLEIQPSHYLKYIISMLYTDKIYYMYNILYKIHFICL